MKIIVNSLCILNPVSLYIRIEIFNSMFQIYKEKEDEICLILNNNVKSFNDITSIEDKILYEETLSLEDALSSNLRYIASYIDNTYPQLSIKLMELIEE